MVMTDSENKAFYSNHKVMDPKQGFNRTRLTVNIYNS